MQLLSVGAATTSAESHEYCQFDACGDETQKPHYLLLK
jgi:hypothetical protein